MVFIALLVQQSRIRINSFYSVNFTTPKQSPENLNLKIEIQVAFQNAMNIEIIGF